MRSIVMILPLVMGAGPFLEGDSTVISDEIRRAQEMLQGVWSFQSMNDNGEKFGPELIHRTFAQNGLVTVKGRYLEIVNPESGQTRKSSFRIDPSKIPHRIDLINRNDRIYRGIYKFDGDDLIVCLERGEDSSRPTEFEVAEGSERILFRLSPVKSKDEATAGANPGINADDAPAVRIASPVTVVASTAPDRPSLPGLDGGRKATEAEIRRAHQMLAGEWDILSIIDDGSDVGPKLIRAKFAEDGRLRIGNRVATFVTPSTEEKHVSAIRIDPAKSPSWIDMTTQLDAVLKGIYKFDGDQLILCLAKHEENPRPTEFEAPSGSDRALFRLAIAKPAERRPVVTTAVVSKPDPKPAPPSPEEKARQRDQQIRDMLVGSWAYSDKKGGVTLVLRPDGTFVSTRSWAKAMKRIFEGPTTTSEGRWAYGHGALTARISSTTDLSRLGQGFSAHLVSIGEDSLVFKDVVGELRTARKLR